MMKIIKTVAFAGIVMCSVSCNNSRSQVQEEEKTTVSNSIANNLKDAFAGKFYIGAALNLDQIYERDTRALELVTSQFNSIVAENCMKAMYTQPKEGEFHFEDADRFVAFGEKNQMEMVGHTLIWHSQPAPWFFTDEQGNDVSREVLIERMRTHIHTLVSRYKGRIQGWDVVNEAILDNGEYRKSKFYQIVGEDFIPLAFQFAHEADPDAELYYNDYSTSIPAKRAGIVKLVKKLKERGCRIDAIGMQEHNGLEHPDLKETEKTIEAFAALGTKVMVTEMEVSVLPNRKPNLGANISDTSAYQQVLDPYRDGLTAEKMDELAKRYKAFFALYLKHKDVISRVNLWGVTDRDSWKNDWPIEGRTDYPLLFDRNYQPKPFVQELIDLAEKS